jgi:hypothetical protein
MLSLRTQLVPGKNPAPCLINMQIKRERLTKIFMVFNDRQSPYFFKFNEEFSMHITSPRFTASKPPAKNTATSSSNNSLEDPYIQQQVDQLVKNKELPANATVNPKALVKELEKRYGKGNFKVDLKQNTYHFSASSVDVPLNKSNPFKNFFKSLIDRMKR